MSNNPQIINSILDNNEQLLLVYNFDKKFRCGPDSDSGYVIGELNITYDCYISAGISTSDDFSLHFINKYKLNHYKCFGFDGTVDNIPQNLVNKLLFIKKNIGTIDDDKTTNLTYLFENNNNIFLKMDIEGSEWTWINNLTNDNMDKISQLAIEIHGLTNMSWHGFTMDSFKCDFQEKIKCLEKLNKTHYLIHAHGNNHDKTAVNGIPNVMELTYIHKKYFSSVPELNSEPLPSKDLDFPNAPTIPDIDLNFFPFVLSKNPFLIDVPDKDEYTNEDYINIQQQLNDKNIDSVLNKLYLPVNNFYDLSEFKKRISRGITQKLIDISNNLIPTKTLYKIGNGGNKRNCFVCCVPFNHKINGIEHNSRFVAAQQILKSLEEVGFNGYFYLFTGGFPNPTGTEMKYAGVPYCFKIFMMLEAQKEGFDKVIWLDSGCYALNNPEKLFDILTEENTLINIIDSNNNYSVMALDQTIRLLNYITKTNLHDAFYIETIVFGLNLESEIIKNMIKEYYEMVKLGWSFFSIFPEEIVFSALFNKPDYKILLKQNHEIGKLKIHEKIMDTETARTNGFYFHHKDYTKYETEK